MECNHCGRRNLKNIQAIRAHLRFCPSKPDGPVSRREPQDDDPEPWVVPGTPTALAQQGSQGGRVLVRYRPEVFDVDPSVVYLYHLFTATAAKHGMEYTDTLGEFVRDTVFHYFLEHPEIVDLTALIGPEEVGQLREGLDRQT